MPLRSKTTTPPEVLPMKEARRVLPQMARCFAKDGAGADPVYFGAHRRPTGVMLSYERYLGILDLLDDLVVALEVRRRDGSDTGERLEFEDLIREQGFDPADFGLVGDWEST